MLYLHTNLVEAAQRHLALEQHRRQLRDYAEWTDCDDDDEPTEIFSEAKGTPLSSLLELTQLFTAGPPSTSRNTLATENISLVRSGHTLIHSFTSSRWDSVAVSCARHLLELKADQMRTIAVERKNLFQLFWLFAPKERTSVHLRVHMLEGSLAVAESQMTQNATIAQWVVTQTSQCAENLRALYHQTQSALSSSVVTNHVRPAEEANFHHTVSRFHGMNLTAVKDQLATEDRVAQGHLQHAQHTCERLVDGVKTLHKRLLESEMLLYHTVGGASEKDKSVLEAQELLEQSLVAHSVDRELAEDSMRLLREFLGDERRLACETIAALLFEVQDRNDEILALRSQHHQLLRLAQSGSWMGQYCAEAFDIRNELYGDALVAVARQYRSALSHTIDETMFQLTVVHFELCEALLSAHEQSLAQYNSMLLTVRTVSNQKTVLREELASMGALLGSIVQQREVERHGVVLLVDEVHATLSDAMDEFFDFEAKFVSQMNSFFVPYVERYYVELAANDVVRQENARVKQSIEEHVIALAASSNSVVAVEALLEEKLAAVRQRDMDVFNLQATIQDHERMATSLKNQIVVLHNLLATEQQRQRIGQEEIHRMENDLKDLSASLEQANNELQKAQRQVQVERDAHQNTIKSIAETVTYGATIGRVDREGSPC